MRIAPEFGSVTLCSCSGLGSRWLRIAPEFGSVTLDRIASLILGIVADCSRVRVGYTRADSPARSPLSCGLLPSSGRLHSPWLPSRVNPALRIAPEFGSVTLRCSPRCHRPELRIAPEFGSVTLLGHCAANPSRVADCSRVRVGYTRNSRVTRHGRSCGLLPSSGRLHSIRAMGDELLRLRIAPEFGSVTLCRGVAGTSTSVADCSRVRVGYTLHQLAPPNLSVADCSRVRVGYTPSGLFAKTAQRCGLLPSSGRLHSMVPMCPCDSSLRIAPEFGSVTLRPPNYA